MIYAFDVRDPEPAANESNTPPVPPHGSADGCGSGGPSGLRGHAPQHMTYIEWPDNYMTGVPAGHWQGMFLAVCNGAPAPLLPEVRVMKKPKRKR